MSPAWGQLTGSLAEKGNLSLLQVDSQDTGLLGVPCQGSQSPAGQGQRHFVADEAPDQRGYWYRADMVSAFLSLSITCVCRHRPGCLNTQLLSTSLRKDAELV